MRFTKKGKISRTAAAEIQGHINFASGFFAAKALRFLSSSSAALADMPGRLGTSELRMLCSLAKSMLQNMPPRTFDATVQEQPVLIFTDGAWEGSNATAGGLYYDPKTGKGLA